MMWGIFQVEMVLDQVEMVLDQVGMISDQVVEEMAMEGVVYWTRTQVECILMTTRGATWAEVN